MNAKRFIQIAWVCEVIWLLLNWTICLYLLPNRAELFIRALPLLSSLIGGQGLFAAVGPEVKRWIESKNGGGM